MYIWKFYGRDILHSVTTPEAVPKAPRSARHPPAYVVKLERGCPDKLYYSTVVRLYKLYYSTRVCVMILYSGPGGAEAVYWPYCSQRRWVGLDLHT